MSPDLNRRDFHQFTLAAFGGMLAGSVVGCAPQPEKPVVTPAPAGAAKDEVSLLMDEPHVCRGLNMCKNQGASKENACAGQGTCASVAAHSCGGMNECKGQGGCGSNPGENTCKGMGSCHVPLEHAWEAARKNFEAAMKAAGKEVGAAPPKA
ncbi:hypothetical protein [Planctomicrobium piriforme]|uniref:Uncharacterized protein n=1 Tax=Planctomicrobium piriforme TaxID=1576369 RepID=A0A1I3EML7_9PLAN|nr:hypothetical protein [Planctomicrobium piriforme]SFI00093.1 hypothetical protein SAMN05421753_104287 [Planctomicrobium piriforme]